MFIESLPCATDCAQRFNSMISFSTSKQPYHSYCEKTFEKGSEKIEAEDGQLAGKHTWFYVILFGVFLGGG